ncbi:hypothetical protein AVEN_249776-1 [Araneus ventricosus]|uniref:Uncharacterized protein n=1 Tax=Araneus ventricosus TaxID=182803 RepID=A0A4Y2C6D3_ARAVE|nr:hypothetical protein AVEN_249776-1 [Araneus ventricosus]
MYRSSQNPLLKLGIRIGISNSESAESVVNPIPIHKSNGPYAPFGFESIEKQLSRNKQNDRPISDSEIKADLSQLFKGSILVPPVGFRTLTTEPNPTQPGVPE